MRNSKFVQSLREKGVFNSLSLLCNGEIMLDYRSKRASLWAGSGIFIIKLGHKYSSHWKNDGSKWFPPYEWREANKFIQKESPNTTWVRSPFGLHAWIPLTAYRRACDLVGKRMTTKMQSLNDWINQMYAKEDDGER